MLNDFVLTLWYSILTFSSEQIIQIRIIMTAEFVITGSAVFLFTTIR
ncbi:MAG: hypothetical protein HYY40_12335 [Bacteroidetes bacterium]|nr:hypothetical protein [Bacteroidota bacterium]